MFFFFFFVFFFLLLLSLIMHDRVTICNDADEKKEYQTGSIFLLRFPPNVTLISYSFPMSVSVTLANIIEVVKNI